MKKDSLNQTKVDQQQTFFEEVSIFNSGIQQNGISADCDCFDCDGNPG